MFALVAARCKLVRTTMKSKQKNNLNDFLWPFSESFLVVAPEFRSYENEEELETLLFF